MRSKKNKTSEISISEEELLPVVKDSSDLLNSIEKNKEEIQDLYDKMITSEDPSSLEREVEANLQSYKKVSTNLRKSYQHIIGMSDELSARWKDIKKGKKRKHKVVVPPNGAIDLAEKKLNHFAKGLNIYKLLLICYIGSFAGVIIELIWCFLRHGYFESRAGLVYGPFNLLYGVGAVCLSLALYKFRNKGRWISFIGGFIVGSVVEYFCSWWQETLFGSTSWDYSAVPFNINGRICLLYSVFWGILGVVWMKIIYPWMVKWILKIPSKFGKVITWVIFAFFIVNIAVTLVSVFRWSQRIDGVAPSNAFWEFIDTRFPNERMSKIFANMNFN